MAFAITIQADSSPIEAILKQLGSFDSLKNQLFGEIGAGLVNSIQHRFLTGTGVDGNPWKVSWRAKLQGRNGVGVGETLRDTGRLMNSYTQCSFKRCGGGYRCCVRTSFALRRNHPAQEWPIHYLCSGWAVSKG